MATHITTVEWDFRDGPRLDDLRGCAPRLRAGDGTLPRWRADTAAGGALHFDGVTDVLAIPGPEVGDLDVSRSSDTVTVAALVRRSNRSTGFVAGMWQEDDADPRRQYGLFLSLPAYGGDQQVCGHVSSDGRAGLPYSRDYAATARAAEVGSWAVAAFSYDGSHITAYLDGVADRRSAFTEVGPPLGAGLTYDKNPYAYKRGLNRGTASDFTIGAVRLSLGMGNHLGGDLARLLVTSSSLTADAHRELAASWRADLPAGHPPPPTRAN